MEADGPDIRLDRDGLAIVLKMVEIEDRSGSIRFAISVNWTHPVRGTGASWTGEFWVAYEALDAFGVDLQTSEAAVLRDLSAHALLALSSGDDPDVLIRETAAGYPYPYGEGPTAVTATVPLDTMRAWGQVISDMPRWWRR